MATESKRGFTPLRREEHATDGFFSRGLGRFVPSLEDARKLSGDTSGFIPSPEQIRHAQLFLKGEKLQLLNDDLNSLKEAIKSFSVALGQHRQDTTDESRRLLDEASRNLYKMMQKGTRGMIGYLYNGRSDGKRVVTMGASQTVKTVSFGHDAVILDDYEERKSRITFIPDDPGNIDHCPLSIAIQSTLETGVVDVNMDIRLPQHPSNGVTFGSIFETITMHNPPERVHAATNPTEQLVSAMPLRRFFWDAVSAVQLEIESDLEQIANERTILENSEIVESVE